MSLLTLARYVLVFGIGLAGLLSAFRTLRHGWTQWRNEKRHRFDAGSFFISDPQEWHHWPASHWLAAGGVVLVVSAGLVLMGLLD